MKLGELIRQARDQWKDGHVDMIGIDALVCHVFEFTKEDLIKKVDQDMAVGKIDEFVDLVSRLHHGEPLSYLINSKEFYGLDFFVDERVLTPRPETEHLVEKIEEIIKRGKIDSLLDIGTGSGCIAVTLAARNVDLKVMATDVSSEALEVAKINAEKHGVLERTNFIVADLMEGVEGRFDIVVANLPYIGTEKFNFVSREAEEFEPHVALFGGKDGLVLYEKLFQQIIGVDWKPKYLLGEFGFLQGERVRELLDLYFKGYEWQIFEDLSSIERGFVVDFGKQ